MAIRPWKAEITEMISDKLKKPGSKKICQGHDNIQLAKFTALEHSINK